MKNRTQKDEKLVFLKKIENADFNKSVLNKMMTTEEECIKWNLVVSLKVH